MIKEGLDGITVAQSTISLVDGEEGLLVYRGHWAEEIAKTKNFEEVAYLLWNGHFPTDEKLSDFQGTMKQCRFLSDADETILQNLPVDMDMMSVIRTVLSSKGNDDFGWPSTIEQAIKITSIIPTIIAYRQRCLNGLDPVKPDTKLGHVANYLYMLDGYEPKYSHVKALTAYLVLTMEHGMNASTFAARVISSTESDLVSAVAGAIGAMKGPLHGGAPSGVIELLQNIGTVENAENHLRQLLDNDEKLMGFGHRVYKTEDPRARALKEITSNLSADDPWFDLANQVEKIAINLLGEYKPGRKLYTNVEFYAAAILKALALPTALFTPTFTMSRVVGWIANVFEQNENNRIIRPSSLYIGQMPKQI
ncbi:citrate synthase/methylcitrate synthase [Pseudalkalibacillus salsuginis]|uniref:citrate synthase/methylcitrate synthase n=1 Tax=Pseudalkalibacillus salsuginis TaxID=2910972 RepID=UPI001F3F16B9|nr:citrate synthase/methylcitrate synthase [Pseudalkalibacillus salsuginis]MCF6409329.1 citrate synthase/methylcitrate synthase [Pseudalkalibacillus salsuginis]